MFPTDRRTMIFAALYALLPLLDVWSHAEETVHASSPHHLDCVRASEQCQKEQACSTKYRTMRQCVAGGKESNFSMVAGLEAMDECRSAMDALKQSPLYNCRCKRGMKKEKNCLRIYWGMYQTLQGNDFLEDSPYEAVNSRLSDIFRLAPILEGGELRSSAGTLAPGRGIAQGKASQDREPVLGRDPLGTGGSAFSTQLQDPSRNRRAHPNWAILGEPAMTRENNCLNAAKACNLNAACKKQRSAYIATCNSSGKSGGGGGGGDAAKGGETCNRKRCHKALRQFLERVPPEFSHQLLFCPCLHGACAERRRQTIVPDCSFKDRVKPNCLELRRVCRQDPLCRSRLADFHMNCIVTQHTASSCPNEDNYQACLASYARLIGTEMTPNYVDSSYSNWTVSPWCSCRGSGNQEEECVNFLRDFTDNTCLRNAIQAFGYEADSAQNKEGSILGPSATARPGPDGSTSSSEPHYIPNDVQPGEDALGKSPLEPISGYGGLIRPQEKPGDGSASLRGPWALVPGLVLALVLLQQAV